MKEQGDAASMPATITFVVLNYNGLEDTLKCLQSFEAVTSSSMNVVVVDNHSHDDPTIAIRERFPHITVLRHHTNGGWAGGNNVGLRWAMEHDSQIVVLLNNDTVVAPEIADRLQEGFAAYSTFAILGPIIHRMDQPEISMTEGCRFNLPDQPGFLTHQSVSIHRSSPPHVVSTDIVNGCCLAVRREVLERIGLIDERYFLIHEESDFCLRALRAGFEVGIVAEPMVWHKQHGTFHRAGKFWQRYYDARNMALLLSKHRGEVGGARGFMASWLEYAKYVYYWYCLARDDEDLRAADAVIEGVLDASAGRFGAMTHRKRLFLPLARSFFNFMRWFQGADSASKTME